MTAERVRKPPKTIKLLHDVELSDKEAFFIGKIVALWGALEFEIFSQTLLSFPEDSSEPLPKEMNNIQFTGVLELWKTHIIDPEQRKLKKKVLTEQYHKILSLADYRAAIVHGMWQYNPRAPAHIKTIRVKKMQLVTVEFPPDSLYDFMVTLQEIMFKVCNPRGPIDHVKAMTEQGGYMSRQFVAMKTGDRQTAHEMLPAGVRDALRDYKEGEGEK